METPSAVREITAFLVDARPSATVGFRRRRGAAVTVVDDLDGLARSLGFRALGGQWIEIDRGAAERLIVRVLGTNLAYDWAEEMEPGEAQRIGAAFLACFPGAAARFFTNGAFTSYG
jgi:hypothetical protein